MGKKRTVEERGARGKNDLNAVCSEWTRFGRNKSNQWRILWDFNHLTCLCLPEVENYCIQIGIAHSVSGRKEHAESAQRDRHGTAAKSQSAAPEKDIGHGIPKLERPLTAVRSLVASHPEEV